MHQLTHPWVERHVEARIGAHVRAWAEAVVRRVPAQLEKQPFITLSREFGCEALPLAQRLVAILNERFRPAIPWVSYDREMLERTTEALHLRKGIVESITEYRRDEMTELFDSILNRKVDESVVFRKMAEVIRTLAMHGHTVLVGRGGYLITHDLKNGMHVRLVAPRAWRIQRVGKVQEVSAADAEQIVDEHEKQRVHFLRTFFVQQRDQPFQFSLAIDNSQFGVPQIAEIIFTALATRFGEELCAA